MPETPTSAMKKPICGDSVTTPTRRVVCSNDVNSTSSTPEYYKQVQLGTPFQKPNKPCVTQQARSTHHPSGLQSSAAVSKDTNIGHPEEDSSIVVAVRVRPLGSKELDYCSGKTVVSVEGNSVFVSATGSTADNKNRKLCFTYDHCLWSSDKGHPQYADQQKVYDVVAQPLLDRAFEGYNTCLFAYGQTGSGKSYSILGHPHDNGIIPRFSTDLFERIQSGNNKSERICVEISYFEIYNEKIHDLLASSAERNKKAPMKVREHPVLGPYIVDLSTFVVTCYDDLSGWLSLGNKQRATAATVMNEKSSRSHSVFTIVLTRVATETIDGQDHEHSRRSKVNLVDLAGSERINVSGTTGLRLKEGASINKSLLTLGKVISQLSDMTLAANGGQKKVFVPYRESVLTWLLKESLGGNSRTTMLATVNPSSLYLEETLSTLRYARQARTIVNVVRVNEDPKARLIRELRSEIEKLRLQQNGELVLPLHVTHQEIQELREKLKEKEQLLKQTTQTLQERLEQATRSKALEAENLLKAGVAFTVSNELPNLVNLNEDPQLSEALVYILRRGSMSIGRRKADSHQDIQLMGSLIAENHCTITNNDNVVTLIPNVKGSTYVNGHLITEPKRLRHGDRIILGGEHYFRLNNAAEMTSESRRSANQKDFTFAREELLTVQEARMKEELEKTRLRTRQEMLDEVEDMRREAELQLSSQRHSFEDKIKELNDALQEQHLLSEKARLELETQRNLMEIEIQAEKQRSEVAATAAAEDNEVVNLSPLRTNFLQDIVQYFNDIDISVMCASGDKDVKGESRAPLGLYELTLMVKEANNLCDDLGKRMVFEQCDRLGDKGFEVVIKVRDVDRDTTLEWSPEVFSDKLEILRHIADGETDLNLFGDSDVWKKDDHLPVSYSPKIRESFQRIQLHRNNNSLNVSASPDSPLNGSRERIDERATLSKAASRPLLQTASIQTTPLPPEEHVSSSQFKFINDHCSAMALCLSEFSSFRASSVDTLKLLLDLSDVVALKPEFLDCMKENQGRAWSLELASRLGLLHGTILLRASRLMPTSFAPCSKRLDELSLDYVKVLDIFCNQASSIIQGLSMQNCSKICSAVDEMHNVVLAFGSLVGQMTASLGMSLNMEGSPAASQVGVEMGYRFLRGTEDVVLRILNTALEKVNETELRMSLLMDDSFFSSAKEDEGSLLRFCHDLVVNIRKGITAFHEKQKSTATSRTECLQRLIQLSSEYQQITANMSLLVEVTVSLCDDTEIFVRGGHIALEETLHLVADIRGSTETLYSLFQIHFGSSGGLNSKQGSPSKDLHHAVKQTIVTSQNLKVVLRQLAKDQTTSTFSGASASGVKYRPSPVKGGHRRSSSSVRSFHRLTNGSDNPEDAGNSRSAPKKQPSKWAKNSPDKSSHSLTHFASPRHRPVLSIQSIVQEDNVFSRASRASASLFKEDETSVWESSIQSSHFFISNGSAMVSSPELSLKEDRNS